MNLIRKMWNDNEGQDLIEYALVAGFIALAAVAGLILLRGSLSTMWTDLSTAVSSAS